MLLVKIVFVITLNIILTSGSSITPKQTTECCEEYCYEEDSSRPQYKNLGNKSAYPFAKGNDTQIYNIPGCSAEKIWMIVRHPTRLPVAGCMLPFNNLENLRDEIVLLYDDTIPDNNLTLPEKGRMCNADLNLLKNWKWDTNITAEYDGDITVSGWNEVKQLAKDYRNAFPDLFGNAYSSENFRFAYSLYRRSEATYKAFIEGLFGDESYNDFTIDQPPNPNLITSPEIVCAAHSENRATQDGPNSETSKFRNSEIFRKLRSDVSRRIGYFAPAFEPLSHVTIFNIYEMCRFEKAWNVEKSSPWCSLFTPSQFKILEYLDDLEHYMKASYGFPLNLKLTCAGMDDMISHLATPTDASPKVVAYMITTWYINAFVTAMGAFKDNIPLSSDNFDEMTNRKWRTSEISPFAANLAAVKYNCPSDVEEKAKVKFFINERTMHLDWCDSSGVCKLSDVMSQYSSFRNGDCEEIFCSSGYNSIYRLSSNFMLLVSSLALLVAAMSK